MISQDKWFTSKEISSFNIEGFSDDSVLRKAGKFNWPSRPTGRSGGGVEYPLSALPIEARIHITMELAKNAPRHKLPDMCDEDRETLWDRWDKANQKAKDKALKLNGACLAVRDLFMNDGLSKTDAVKKVALQIKVCERTIWNAFKRVDGVHREDWTAALIPFRGAARPEAEISPEVWEMIKADWLRPEKPSFADCYRRAEAFANDKDLIIPSQKSILRRLNALPSEVKILSREGESAIKQMYPAQQRDKRAFKALECVNSDGHKLDVFVKWPDGEIGRPVLVGFQDVYSGKLLSWRIDKSENTEAVRLAFGDMIEKYGIPEHVVLDNGRNFASKWLTGGIPNRFRFKVKEEEPQGILPALGCKVHWTTPYSGQSKPIERFWRDVANSVAKHPAFAGAYVGKNTVSKPENYGSHAVPFEEFLMVLDAGIKELNSREGRRSAVCQGGSLDQAFAESYAKASIRKASQKQRLLWLLAAECVKPSRKDGSITLLENRYWSEFLTQQIGNTLTIRFDPQNLQGDLHVYSKDGIYLGSAPCIQAVGFLDQQAAQEHKRNKQRFTRAAKEQLKALRKMSPQDVAKAMEAINSKAETEENLAESKIVRPLFNKSSEEHGVFEGGNYGELSEAEQREQDEQYARILSFEKRQTA